MRDEAVIPRVPHGGIKKAIDDQCAGGLVHFIFDRFTANGNLDHDVHFVGRILAN